MTAGTDAIWKHVLDYVNFTGENNFTISAKQIKASGKTWLGKDNQFEPRILAYQPSSLSRPQCFKDHNICILPIRNGLYILTKTSLYQRLDYNTGSEVIPIQRNTSSQMLSMGESEASHISNLRYSGVFERPELLGEEIKFGPLLNGRHRCSMEVQLDGITHNIEGVQFETDSCYETTNRILIVEAKNIPKEIDSFNIRQLYNPFRVVHDHMSEENRKEIICIFVHKLKSTTHVWKYTFEDPKRIDSIKLKGHYMYCLR